VTSISGEQTKSQRVTIGQDITFTGWLDYVRGSAHSRTVELQAQPVLEASLWPPYNLRRLSTYILFGFQGCKWAVSSLTHSSNPFRVL
jgi:hypothetical protein